MKNQYVFEDEQTAIDAEKYICNVAGFPWVGKNAKTGKAQPDKQQTVRWSRINKRATDDKWYFEALPDSDLEGVPQNIIDTFNDDFPHTTEEKQSNWSLDE